jgi:DNA-binding transcriptional MerR regulator
MKHSNIPYPIFSRGEVAKILHVTTATIANREKRGVYPEPSRDMNDHRYYTIEDILLLQVISFKQINPKVIVELLYDKGLNPNDIPTIIDNAIAKITAK